MKIDFYLKEFYFSTSFCSIFCFICLFAVFNLINYYLCFSNSDLKKKKKKKRGGRKFVFVFYCRFSEVLPTSAIKRDSFVLKRT